MGGMVKAIERGYPQKKSLKPRTNTSAPPKPKKKLS